MSNDNESGKPEIVDASDHTKWLLCIIAALVGLIAFILAKRYL